MSYDDFLKYFNEIGICNPWILGSTCHTIAGQWVPGLSAGGPPGFASSFPHNPAALLTVLEAEKGAGKGKKKKTKKVVPASPPSSVLVSCSLSLSQKDLRGQMEEGCSDGKAEGQYGLYLPANLPAGTNHNIGTCMSMSGLD
jgi:hypothetical protein